jgi:nucleoside-diphosphate-sugar epimerase
MLFEWEDATMRVLVTGAGGKVGRAAVRALKSAGHKVVETDWIVPADKPHMVKLDATDFGEVMGALSGVDTVSRRVDAVLHLAGIPRPGPAPDHRIFENNTQSTYAVFSAAVRLGIKKIVWASSETLLGLPFDVPPAYAPLDEKSPLLPNWSYALSKLMGEDMAAQFCRWNADLSIISLRFSNVFAGADYDALPAIQASPESRKFNLWGYVDAEDCGAACLLALEADAIGHHPLIIAAADNIAGQDSRALMATHFPGVDIRGDGVGDGSLLSSALAAETIGYSPQFSWRDRVEQA